MREGICVKSGGMSQGFKNPGLKTRPDELKRKNSRTGAWRGNFARWHKPRQRTARPDTNFNKNGRRLE